MLAPKWGLSQAAEILGIGTTKLRRIVLDGEIPVVKIGGKYLLFERDIIKFVEGKYGKISKRQKMALHG